MERSTVSACPTCKRPTGWIVKPRTRWALTDKGRAYLAEKKQEVARA